MAVKKNNLSRDFVRLLRKIQKFLIEEPRRFDMLEGVIDSSGRPSLLEQPPCGTACCIAGAGYVIANNVHLDHTSIGFGRIYDFFGDKYKLDGATRDRLFYTRYQAGPFSISWPMLYSDAYKNAKTPLERACVGVARIEHFIATDGRE